MITTFDVQLKFTLLTFRQIMPTEPQFSQYDSSRYTTTVLHLCIYTFSNL